MRSSKTLWKVRFAWFPRMCDLTGKIIWLEYAYHGQKLLTGPDHPVLIEYWHKKNDHLLWVLTYD